MTAQKDTKSGNHWIQLFIILFAISSSTIAMFKVATVMDSLMAEFSLNAAQGGLITSIFSVVPIFLAIPVGVIIARYGSWKVGLLGMSCVVIGSLIGIYSHSLTPLLVSRVIEGVAMAFFINLGPYIVNNLFEPERRGTAMGILLSFISVGQFIVFAAAPSIVSATGGWRGVWWFTVVYAMVFIVIWALGLRRLDKGASDPGDKDEAAGEKIDVSLVLKNADVWIITAAILLYSISQQGALSFISSFLTNGKGIDAAAASHITSLIGIVGIFAMVISGTLSDKLRSRKWMTVILSLICGAVYFIFPQFPAGMAVAGIVLFSLSVNMIPSLYFLAIGEANDNPGGIALSTAILTTGQFIGTFIGSILFGILLDKMGWTAAFDVFGVIIAANGILFIFLRKVKR